MAAPLKYFSRFRYVLSVLRINHDSDKFEIVRRLQTTYKNNSPYNVIALHPCKLQDSKASILKYGRQFCSTTHKSRVCWKCGSKTDSVKELFFCNCGIVQEVPTDLTYFKVLDCKEEFNIDVEKLSKLYKQLQRDLHPDKYSQKSQEELVLAENQSSYINKAYFTLLKPLSRGLYLMELRGNPLEEANSSVEPDFLMEIMEINEDIMEAGGNIEQIKPIENENTEKMEECVRQISDLFAVGNIEEAKVCVIRLKYFANIDDKIKEVYRDQM